MTALQRVRHVARKALAGILQRVPEGLVLRLARWPRSAWARRIAWLGLEGRTVSIAGGPGKGLLLHLDQPYLDYALGTNEEPVQQELAKQLEPGAVFYDIGANIGFFTLLGARCTGSTGLVYAFEPDARNVEQIRRNAALNRFDQVEVIPRAVTSATGRGELLLARHCGGHTLAGAGVPPDLTGATIVDLVSLDDFLIGEAVRPPQLVKIDVEGAEADVLRGMSRTLDEIRPVLIIEIDDQSTDGIGDKHEMVTSLLAPHGYECQVLPRSYRSSNWKVIHIVARPPGGREVGPGGEVPRPRERR